MKPRNCIECLHCGLVMRGKQNLVRHMRIQHKVVTIEKARDWDDTNKEPTRKYKKKKKTGRLYVCTHCSAEYDTWYAARWHVINAHGLKSCKKDVDWEVRHEDGVQSEVRAVPVKSKKRKNELPVITPDMQYIDIPVILRIPLMAGTGQFIQPE